MKYVVAFVRFWYDFIVGDDWAVAAGIVVAIALTALVAEHSGGWWAMPLAVVVLLLSAVWRGARRSAPPAGAPSAVAGQMSSDGTPRNDARR